MTLPRLELSNDRKVANSVNAKGTQANVANTFGLPSGREFSCPGQTPACEAVCYAGKLEKVFPSMRAKLIRNWEALQGKNRFDMALMICAMLDEFRAASVKRDAALLFRIHFDGDFFSRDYATAWRYAIATNPDIQFWAYTRTFEIVDVLADLPNLALYLSVDRDNIESAKLVRAEFPSVRWAWLGETAMAGEAIVKAETGRPGAACPENLGRIPLISTKGSACVTCGLCVKGKADIRFSVSKR